MHVDIEEIYDSPVDYGVGGKFAEWRHYQPDAIRWLGRQSKRFMGLCLPTGSGKSLIYIVRALMDMERDAKFRAAVLTSTKGLQDQLMQDFADTGLVDLRGRANYLCEQHKGLDCSTAKHCCKHSNKLTCAAKAAVYRASRSELVVTNYAAWIAHQKGGSGLCVKGKDGNGDSAILNPFSMLIMDEAQNAELEVSRALQVVINSRELEAVGRYAGGSHKVELLPVSASVDDHSQWASEAVKHVAEAKITALEIASGSHYSNDIKSHKQLAELATKLATVATMSDKSWVVDSRLYKRSRSVMFDVIWPGAYTEKLLFAGIPKVALVSATLCDKTMSLNGVPKGDRVLKSWPQLFDAERHRVWYIPTANVKKYKTQAKHDQMMKRLVSRVDQIIGKRLDRKGIIHTVSFDRSEEIMEASKYSQYMIANKSSNADVDKAPAKVIEFRRANPPAVLLSPSISTGWDFPGDECRYLIVVKVPFPPMVSPVMRKRKERDPMYAMYQAMQTFEQSLGRAMRSEDDWCEIFVIDNNVVWFMKVAATYSSKGLKVSRRITVPRPYAPEDLQC